MSTQELKDRFYFLCEQLENNQIDKVEARQIAETIYGAMQEESDRLSLAYDANKIEENFVAQSNAHLDRFEVNQQLRLRGLEMAY